MTLVIAKIDRSYNDFRIISDTQITDEVKAEKSKYFGGVVKSFIYTPHITISCAGSNVSAEEIHKSIFGTAARLSLISLCKVLLTFQRHRGNDIDFLLTTIQLRSISIIKISNGKIETGNSSYWIGDFDAFEGFQEKFHEYSLDKRNNLYQRTEKAFTDIILNPNYTNVGGVQVEIMRTQYGFQYIARSKSVIGRPITLKAARKGSQILDFGSYEEGAFNYSRLISKNPIEPAFGDFYSDGRFGVFAYPKMSRSFFFYKDLDIEEFVRKVKNDHMIQLTGPFSHRGIMKNI